MRSNRWFDSLRLGCAPLAAHRIPARTTASTLACCGLLPLNLYIYVQVLSDRHIHIDWPSIAVSVAVVVSAVAAGLGVAAWFPQHRRTINGAGSVAGVVLMA